MLRFRRMGSLQKCASTHSSVHNHFNLERYLCSRSTFKANRNAALRDWRDLLAAWHLLVREKAETGSH